MGSRNYISRRSDQQDQKGAKMVRFIGEKIFKITQKLFTYVHPYQYQAIKTFRFRYATNYHDQHFFFINDYTEVTDPQSFKPIPKYLKLEFARKSNLYTKPNGQNFRK
jgi:hypothetical protein